MSLVEVICSIFMVACSGLATTVAWTSAVNGLREVSELRALHNVSASACEKIYAHQPVPFTEVENGYRFTISCTQEASDNGRLEGVSVETGREREELWLLIS